MSVADAAPLRRGRVAVGVMFAVNGMTAANLMPRYPEITAQLGLDNARFGLAIACWPAGALISGLLAGAAVTRWTSARVTLVCSLIMVVLVYGAVWAPSWITLAVVFFAVGLVDALIDIANNAHGLRIQRQLGRSIITGLHGVWSVGAVVGGLIGSGMAGLDVPLRIHLAVTGLVFAVTAVVAARFLLPGRDTDDRPPETEGTQRWTPGRIGRVAVPLGIVGLIAVAGAAGEDAGNTWGALYLTGELGTSAAVGGAAFVAMQGVMIIGRFAGDPLVIRYGARAVSRSGAVLMIVGLALVVAVPSVVPVVIGFGVVGLGIAVLIPLAMHAADEVPGLPPGFGLSAAGWMMRFGFLITPPIIGVLADATSLRWALLMPAVLGVVSIVCSARLADRHGLTVGARQPVP